MKSSDKPQLVKKWWTSEKPPEVKGTDLEQALAAVEKALANENNNVDGKSIDTSTAALRDLASTVDKTIKKELDKKKHKDCIVVLGKYDDLIEAELKRLDVDRARLAAVVKKDEGEGNGEDEDEGKLFDPEYLYKMVKVLRSSGKELNFGFGMNKETPETSRLLLARTGKPEKLFRALKQSGQFSTRLLMCGYAFPDPANAKVLTFRVEEAANEPPQIVKLGRRYLRADKNLHFRKLKLVVPGGQTYEDTDPDAEDDVVAATAAARVVLPKNTTLEEAPEVWRQMRRVMKTNLDQLKAVVRKEFAADSGMAADIEKASKRMDVVFNTLDDQLAAALARVPAAKAGAARDVEMKNVKTVIANYMKYVKSEPVIAHVDANPFDVAMELQKTLKDSFRYIIQAIGT